MTDRLADAVQIRVSVLHAGEDGLQHVYGAQPFTRCELCAALRDFRGQNRTSADRCVEYGSVGCAYSGWGEHTCDSATGKAYRCKRGVDACMCEPPCYSEAYSAQPLVCGCPCHSVDARRVHVEGAGRVFACCGEGWMTTADARSAASEDK